MAGRDDMRRLILLVVVLLVAVCAVAYGAASAVVYDDLTKVTGDCPASMAANTPEEFDTPDHPTFDATPYLMPAPDTVAFPSRDPAITISGWFISAPDKSAPAVVIVHGHGSCKRAASVLVPAGMLHRDGFAVLLIDLRDHGDSTYEDGRYAGGTEEYRDVLGGWDWLQSAKGYATSQIGLLGVSLGAATALIATGEEPRVAAVWEDSSYADIEVAIRAELARNGYPTFLEPGGLMMARLLSGDELASRSPLDAVHKLHGRPIFITHGDADQRLSVAYGHQLEAAVASDGGAVESWFVPGAGHIDAMFLHPEEYGARLVAFFRQTLRH